MEEQKTASSVNPNSSPVTPAPEQSNPQPPVVSQQASNPTPAPTPNSTGSTTPPPNPAPASPPSPKGPGVYRIIIVLIALILVGGLAFVAWFFQAQLQKTTTKVTTEDAQASVPQKKFIVGTDPTYPPMEYMENGKLIGYDIDLANFLAKELKRDIEIKSIEFDSLFTSLEKSEIDAVISGVTITDERKQKYDFSKEYINAGQVIITQKADTIIKSTMDLRGKRIAIQKGTTNETEAKKYTDPTLVIAYENFDEATKALVEGTSDAVFTDLPNAKGIILSNPTLKIASDPFTNETYGIVMRKGDPSVKQINQALKALEVKGILTDLKKKWLE